MERARWIYWVIGGIVAIFALPALAVPFFFIAITMSPVLVAAMFFLRSGTA